MLTYESRLVLDHTHIPSIIGDIANILFEHQPSIQPTDLRTTQPRQMFLVVLLLIVELEVILLLFLSRTEGLKDAIEAWLSFPEKE